MEKLEDTIKKLAKAPKKKVMVALPKANTGHPIWRGLHL